MSNLSKSIITSASNKFAPSLLNMLGSFEKNCPNHPHIYIYDLGISSFIKKEILKFNNVSIIEIPHFVPFWRSCYTWKTYILNTPLADLNFYIDAGCQILQPLDAVFEQIEKNGYYLVSQGKEVFAKDIIPTEYIELFDIESSKLDSDIIAAGLFGFKKDDVQIKNITTHLFQAGISGLCLGFSKKDQWKNKGKNKNIFLRNCNLFRHDTTVLTLLIIKYFNNPTVQKIELFDGQKSNNPDQLIWNLRMNYNELECIMYEKLSFISNVLLRIFIQSKKLRLWAKGIK